MHNLIIDGRVHEQFAKRPTLHPSMQVVDDGGAPGVAIGWVYDGEKFSPPPPPKYSQTRLMDYADDRVMFYRQLSRPYKIDGFAEPIVDDFGHTTGADLTRLAATMAAGMLEFPFQYEDETYKKWTLTEGQLRQFLAAGFAYEQSLWRFKINVVTPMVRGGKVTTPEQIDALDWPK
jgi:hypothetical protein